MTIQVWSALAAGGAGLGITLIIAGVTRSERSPLRSRLLARLTTLQPQSPADIAPTTARAARSGDRLHEPLRWRRLAVIAATAVGVLAATGWPVAAGLTIAGLWWLPSLLGPDRVHDAAVARIEAVAGWAEQLRDTLAAAAGLEQAITATATTAPILVRPAVTDLADRIRAGDRLPAALRQAAHDIADPTGDLVVVALTLAAQQQARHLGDLLAALAAAAREEAAGRMRTAVARARVRTGVRVIVCATLSLAAGLILLNSLYLSPYSTLEGQAVLLCVGGLFAVAFRWLAHIGRPRPTPRLIAPPTPVMP